VRVQADGHTVHTDGSRQTGLIIYPMLYAMSIGQIIKNDINRVPQTSWILKKLTHFVTYWYKCDS